MPKGSELARVGCPYLGRPYSEMDCQAFVEKCLSDIGIRKDLSGSNAWYRYIMKNGWIGTPAECKSMFGKIPEGAFLFIHAFDGGEEKRGYHDGLGNASHIGIYTGLTGTQMVDIAEKAGNQKAAKYNFGDGAINSSSTREAVATSKFYGKAISGGWNKIGLWGEITYGEPFDSILHGGDTPTPEPGGKTMIATAWADTGKTVNLRKSKSHSSKLVDQIPIGDQVEVTEKGTDWCHCKWKGKTGYVMTQYLVFGEVVPGEDEDPIPVPKGMVLVDRGELEKVYDIIGNMLGRRG